MRRRGFTLIELLVVIAIVALLVGLMLPALGSARSLGRQSVCMSRQRQLAMGWTLYAGDFADRAMPLADFEPAQIGAGDAVFWFGSDGRVTGRIDYEAGHLTRYLESFRGDGSVYECPEQPWGTYAPQTRLAVPTTTYGYNGYYLSPRATPGWGGPTGPIGRQRWQRLSTVRRPSDTFVFADTLLSLGSRSKSTALLDPPRLFDGRGGWSVNRSATTSFRHSGSTVSVRADGSVAAYAFEPDWLTSDGAMVGSVGLDERRHYVPDAADWR